MNSVLICEGSTDYALLQYYMRKVNNWEDDKLGTLKYENNRARDLKRGNDILTIMSSGGCSNLTSAFKNVLDRNYNSKPDESDAIHQVVIITDRDEAGTESSFIAEINKTLVASSANPAIPLTNNKWTTVSMKTNIGGCLSFEFLVMVIPFSGNGAMETFLLDAICDSSDYDKQIIERGKSFVNNADPEKKYLTKRRYCTKAEFDAYFCIRTAADQFEQRQSILKAIPWEEYSKIQKDFILLGKLGNR